jgi:hypothetical protein
MSSMRGTAEGLEVGFGIVTCKLGRGEGDSKEIDAQALRGAVRGEGSGRGRGRGAKSKVCYAVQAVSSHSLTQCRVKV